MKILASLALLLALGACHDDDQTGISKRGGGGPIIQAPEMDTSSSVTALTLLCGAVVVLLARRK
jgi:hypothetical protein